ncbi:MAG: hypothetical protein HC871_04745 [Rhizobiales bacterium]|nr:hypothetical protein [Hyphomicrobiales bacterium]
MDEDDNNEFSRMIFDALLAEYQQLYEHARHDDNIGLTVQGLLLTVSFGILGYTIGARDISTFGLIFGAITSLATYLFYIFHFEQLLIIVGLRYDRIIEIEKLLAKELRYKDIGFIKDFRQLYKGKRDEKTLVRISDYINPARLVIHFSKILSLRYFRVGLFVILILLWTARFFQ